MCMLAFYVAETDSIQGTACRNGSFAEGKESGPRTNAVTCEGIDGRKQIEPNNG